MKKISRTPRTDARMIYADSVRDADLFYATKMSVGDPFLFFETQGRSYIVMSDLEIDRAKKQAQGVHVLSFSDYQAKFKKQLGNQPLPFARFVAMLLKDFRIRSVTVPSSFPLGLAEKLREEKIRVVPLEGAFYPQREIKTNEEVRYIRDALRLTAVGLQTSVDALKKSRIGKGGFLYLKGDKLTSERLRAMICSAILWAGGDAGKPIVAGGVQACDPHETGYGPLRAHQAIIVDIFPRSQKTGYFGDMTRTFVRGRASEALRKLYATVHKAQKAAIKNIRAGVDGKMAHEAVQHVFDAAGYETGKIGGRMQGFFHGTGHGLGLEVHEAPRVNAASNILKAGQVVTVEPGLYYTPIGGVRIEDVTLVTKSGNKLLSSFPYFLEI